MPRRAHMMTPAFAIALAAGLTGLALIQTETGVNSNPVAIQGAPAR